MPQRYWNISCGTHAPMVRWTKQAKGEFHYHPCRQAAPLATTAEPFSLPSRPGAQASMFAEVMERGQQGRRAKKTNGSMGACRRLLASQLYMHVLLHVLYRSRECQEVHWDRPDHGHRQECLEVIAVRKRLTKEPIVFYRNADSIKK